MQCLCPERLRTRDVPKKDIHLLEPQCDQEGEFLSAQNLTGMPNHDALIKNNLLLQSRKRNQVKLILQLTHDVGGHFGSCIIWAFSSIVRALRVKMVIRHLKFVRSVLDQNSDLS